MTLLERLRRKIASVNSCHFCILMCRSRSASPMPASPTFCTFVFGNGNQSSSAAIPAARAGAVKTALPPRASVSPIICTVGTNARTSIPLGLFGEPQSATPRGFSTENVEEPKKSGQTVAGLKCLIINDVADVALFWRLYSGQSPTMPQNRVIAILIDQLGFRPYFSLSPSGRVL